MLKGDVQNPLLFITYPIPFDRIRPEHVRPAFEALLAQSRDRIRAILEVRGARTYENTLRPFDSIAGELTTVMNIVGILGLAGATYAGQRFNFQEAHDSVISEYQEFKASIYLDEDLWAAIRDYAATEEAAALTGTRRNFLDHVLLAFRANGANVDPEKKARLRAIAGELAAACAAHRANLQAADEAFVRWFDDPEPLKGVPPFTLDAARQDAEAHGRPNAFRFTLKEWSYWYVTMGADDPAIREEFHRAHLARATSGERNNITVCENILRLRRERAQLLGKSSYASVKLEQRMARDCETVQAFLDDLRDRLRPHFEREKAELLDYRRSIEGPDAAELQDYDWGYYRGKLRRERLDLDPDAVRPYFSLDHVLASFFSLFEEFFGVRFEEQATRNTREGDAVPVWHPSVQVFTLTRPDSGQDLGSLYLDLFAREGKAGGAGSNGVLPPLFDPETGEYAPGTSFLITNLTPPSENAPVLMSHGETRMLAHEFGHVLNQILSRIEVQSLCVNGLPVDAGEIASMTLGSLAGTKAFVRRISAHYETGEPLPEELLDQLAAAANFQATANAMSQLGFAQADLALHSTYDPDRNEVMAFTRAIMEAHSSCPLPEVYGSIVNTPHLFSDAGESYCAGYYGYPWSEVIAEDIASTLITNGELDPLAGRRFGRLFLARGADGDARLFAREVLGRDPNAAAFVKRFEASHGREL